jgi:hypothetical protein
LFNSKLFSITNGFERVDILKNTLNHYIQN